MADEARLELEVDSRGGKAAADALTTSLDAVSTSAGAATDGLQKIGDGSTAKMKALTAEVASLKDELSLVRDSSKVALGDLATECQTLRDELAALKKAAEDTGDGLDGVEKKAGRAGASTQIMDHVVRSATDAFAAGASPIQAFVMELGRIIEAAEMSGGSLGKVGAFMMTPWGVALSFALTALAPMVTKLFDTSDAAKQAEKDLKAFEDRQKDMGRFIDEVTGKLIQQNRQLAANRVESLKTEVLQGNASAQGYVNQAFYAAREQATSMRGRNKATYSGESDDVAMAIQSAGSNSAVLNRNFQALAARYPDLQNIARTISTLSGQAADAAINTNKLRGQSDELTSALRGEVVVNSSVIEGRVAAAHAATGVSKAEAELNAVRERGRAIDKMDAGPAKTALYAQYETDLGKAIDAENAEKAAAAANRKEHSELTKELNKEAAARKHLQEVAAQRKKNTDNFWTNLETGAADAGQPGGQASEQLKEEADLKRIINDGDSKGAKEITQADKDHIAGLLRTKAINTDNRTISDAITKANLATNGILDQQADLIAKGKDGLEDQRKLDQEMLPYRTAALKAGNGVIDDGTQKLLDQLEAILKGNIALERRNALMERGNELVDKLSTQEGSKQALLNQYSRDSDAIGASTRPEEAKEAAYKQLDKNLTDDLDKINKKFFDTMSDDIDQIGKQFKGVFGTMVASVGKLALDISQQAKDGYQSGDVGSKANNPVSKVASSLQGMTKTLGDSFAGISKALGQASDGAAVGEQVGGIMKSLGLKTSKTGAEIGGAVGSFIPIPGGQIIGSIAGGLIGGLFKPTNKASDTIDLVGGLAKAGTATGHGKDALKNAQQLADDYASSLNSIVSQLGGTLSSTGGLTVGYRSGQKNPYRVDLSGDGRTKGVSKFATEQEAEAFALQTALSRGAITGLSSLVQNVIKAAGTDIDTGVANAVKVQNFEKDLKQRLDPVNSSLDDLNTSFTSLKAIMDQAGASTQDYADLQKDYELQRADIIKQGNDEALKDMKDYLFQLQGGTSSPLSPEARYAASKSNLDTLDAERSAGTKVDFDTYKTAADAFLAASRDDLGSSVGYFSDVNRVEAALQQMIDTTNTSVTSPDLDLSPVTDAVVDQTTQVTTLLTQIAANTSGGSGVRSLGTTYAEF